MNSLKPARSRKSETSGFIPNPPGSNRPRRIGDILNPLAKKIIITAYLERFISRERAVSLIKSLGLGGGRHD